MTLLQFWYFSCLTVSTILCVGKWALTQLKPCIILKTQKKMRCFFIRPSIYLSSSLSAQYNIQNRPLDRCQKLSQLTEMGANKLPFLQWQIQSNIHPLLLGHWKIKQNTGYLWSFLHVKYALFNLCVSENDHNLNIKRSSKILIIDNIKQASLTLVCQPIVSVLTRP